MLRCGARIGVLLLIGVTGCAKQTGRPVEAAGAAKPSSLPTSSTPGAPRAAAAPAAGMTEPDTKPSVSATDVVATSRWDVRRLEGAAEASPARPRRVGRRDVRFEGASLDNAFRMLAEVGRFDLVLDGDFGQVVSQVLRNVEPFDALTALAEAHGAQVGCLGPVVTVTARGKASAESVGP